MENHAAYGYNDSFELVQIAMSEFSINLFYKVLAAEDENVVISPLSAYYAMAMIGLGARGDTLDEFMNFRFC